MQIVTSAHTRRTTWCRWGSVARHMIRATYGRSREPRRTAGTLMSRTSWRRCLLAWSAPAGAAGGSAAGHRDGLDRGL